MRNIAYVGFGDLGQQVSRFLKQTATGPISEVYFDDQLFSSKTLHSFPFSAYKNPEFSHHDFFVCLGYKNLALKSKIIDELKRANRKLPNFIHPSAIINPSVQPGAGIIIYPGCNIDQNAALEDGVLLNNSVTISHNTVIGKSSFMAPGVIVCGYVRIGMENFAGAGSIFSNNVITGDNVITGIGTVVTKNIAAGSSVIGNPMRHLSKKINLR
ncbi:MAG: hypothetical protein K2X48_09630 [Chitinophagaceae bacterium]|nr:hypothetical protein [Chitinophagaceae bacterium]